MDLHLREDRTHECPLKADDRTVPFFEIVSGTAVRISFAFDAVLFVSRQTREAEQCDRDIVGTFMRQEVPVVRSAKTREERKPFLRVGLEFWELVWIDGISEVTSDHHQSIIERGGGRDQASSA